jgi:hypothetical protein
MFDSQQPYWTGHGGYVSEFTRFMNAFLQEHPEVVENQRKGWTIFWDSKVDFDALEKAREDGVPTLGGYYYPD